AASGEEAIAQGHSNAVIAERLILSPKTVSNHIANIFSKLQVADRAQAIVRARGPGLAKKPDWVTVPLVELNTQTRGHLAFPRTRRADVLVRRRRALAEGRRFARVRRIDPLGAPGNSLILAVAP
ncbi:MAG TPA: LuxR C-terminal-related transcriptional regulator, partial [Anaerolineae bacterium]|nr:LuxR C-terminal-related transcriptional regulator [Anaerolineae bacterium]